MQDRGMKKWKPFNSVISTKKLLEKPEKIILPSLSEDQIFEYENYILDSLYNNIIIEIIFYKNDKKFKEVGTIRKIDKNTKDIFLENNIRINFRQIYSVRIKEE